MEMEKFFNRMQEYLSPEDFKEFYASFDRISQRCIRINPLKVNKDDLVKIFPYSLLATSISPYHYLINEDLSGNHPYHLAGLFYMQEASAGSAVEALHINPGDYVLDLCAAPGGKSTQISAYLNQNGLLVSNEYVNNRAQILLSNTERIGAQNTIVTNEHPEKLCTHFAGYFNKVLVDAPCSGEGMFRKNDDAINHWSQEHVNSCAIRQKEILASAYKALAEGGEIVYSTCTFSKEENEMVIEEFLENHPDMKLIDPNVNFGRPGLAYKNLDNTKVRRIYPMDGGDGHFVARMKKEGNYINKSNVCKGMRLPKEAEDFLKEQLDNDFYQLNKDSFYMENDNLYYWPFGKINLKGIHTIRCGVLCGSLIKGHFKPHHHFYMALCQYIIRKLSLPISDERINLYLHGNEISCDEESWNGYGALCVDGYVLGFIKKNQQQCKNHYPKGLRLQ